MTVKELHRESMKFNDLALIAKQRNDFHEIHENYSKAFEFEKKAFIKFNEISSEEPTRSVLIRSAANLAILSKQFREAEKLISIGLAGNISDEFAKEFRDLFQDISFHRHLELNGVSLGANELQLSLSGNQVGHGLIRSDEFLNRMEIIEKIAYRTADRLKKNPFAERNRPKKDDARNFEPYLSVPRAASFAVTIRFGQTSEQTVIEGLDPQSFIIDDILKNIKLINEDNYLQLNENIQDESYRRNFIALTKQLAPDGDRIKLVGFTTTKNKENVTVSLTKSNQELDSFHKQEIYTTSELVRKQISVPISLEGYLSFAESRKSQIKLTDDNNKDIIIDVPNGLLSDIVKPFFEEKVIIKATRIGKKIILDDIAKSK